jgi:hypothetical protein
MERVSKIFANILSLYWALPFFLLFLVFNSAPLQQLDSANYYLEGLLTLRGWHPFLEFNDSWHDVISDSGRAAKKNMFIRLQIRT